MKGPEREFIIPVKGLPVGKHRYSFSIDGQFFRDFGNSQIITGSLVADVVLARETACINLDSNIKGSVVVECDRCLEELTVPLDINAKLLIKFAKGEQENDSDEIMILDPDASELDIKQFLYDYICISLPVQAIHRDGECNPEMVKRLEKTMENSSESGGNFPFYGLKDIID